MIALTDEEREAVRAYQLGRAAGRFVARAASADGIGQTPWATSFAALLRPYDEDGSLDMVIAAGRHADEVRGVAIWTVGARRCRCESCLGYVAINWSINWRVPPDETVGGWWQDCLTRPRRRGHLCPVLPWAPLVNAGACDGTAWQWAARAARLVEPKELPEFLAAYAQHPEVELMARAGLGAPWWSERVLATLSRSAALRSWVARNAEALATANAGPSVALSVAARGGTVDDVREEAYYRALWHGCALHGVDRREAAKYCDRHQLTRYEYADLLDLSLAAGLDPRARAVAFPADPHAALERFRSCRDRILAEQERRRAAERDADMRRRAEEAVAALARLRLPDGARVVVPRSQGELVAIGRRMRNCIGSGVYARRMADGACVCVVIEIPDGPPCAAELVPETGRVAQCYATGNTAAPETVRAIARRAAQALRRAAA